MAQGDFRHHLSTCAPPPKVRPQTAVREAGLAAGHGGDPAVTSAWRSHGEDVSARPGATEALYSVAQLGSGEIVLGTEGFPYDHGFGEFSISLKHGELRQGVDCCEGFRLGIRKHLVSCEDGRHKRARGQAERFLEGPHCKQQWL